MELTDPEAAKKFVEKEEVVVVGFFESNTSDNAVAYLGAADASSDTVQFAITTSSAVAKALDADMGSIVVFRPVSY